MIAVIVVLDKKWLAVLAFKRFHMSIEGFPVPFWINRPTFSCKTSDDQMKRVWIIISRICKLHSLKGKKWNKTSQLSPAKRLINENLFISFFLCHSVVICCMYSIFCHQLKGNFNGDIVPCYESSSRRSFRSYNWSSTLVSFLKNANQNFLV